jgi:acetyl-CoA C-acetyltransferase/acetyl-CoA acyltransferase
MAELYIVEGTRTPFCKMGTLLSKESAATLGISATKSLINKAGISPEEIDEVIFGCVGQPASEMNVSKIIASRVGLPESVPAVTVHRNCASGLESITYASAKAKAKEGQIFLCGGTENMSQMPLLFSSRASEKFFSLFGAKTLAQKIKCFSKFRVKDIIPQVSLRMGLNDPISGINMGETAELLAREFEITREMQDAFSFLSHEKASTNRAKILEEISPVYTCNDDCIKSPDGSFVGEDNGIREDSTISKLNRLRPIFQKRDGTVTAGNSSQVTDGAVSILVMTEEGLNKTGSTPLAKIKRYAHVGCDPKRMGLGPFFALKKMGTDLKDLDLLEINEAFAAQALACKKLIDENIGQIPDDKLNVNGGAIALGHPVGASGARVVLTLAKELKRRGAKKGVATLCVGGGQGSAIELESC